MTKRYVKLLSVARVHHKKLDRRHIMVAVFLMVIFSKITIPVLGSHEEHFLTNLVFVRNKCRLIVCSFTIESTHAVYSILGEHNINLYAACVNVKFAEKMFSVWTKSRFSRFWKMTIKMCSHRCVMSTQFF